MLSVSSTVAVLAAANTKSREKAQTQEIDYLTESELLNEAGEPLNETELRIKKVDQLLKEFRAKEAQQDNGDIVVTLMMCIFVFIIFVVPVLFFTFYF